MRGEHLKDPEFIAKRTAAMQAARKAKAEERKLEEARRGPEVTYTAGDVVRAKPDIVRGWMGSFDVSELGMMKVLSHEGSDVHIKTKSGKEAHFYEGSVELVTVKSLLEKIATMPEPTVMEPEADAKPVLIKGEIPLNDDAELDPVNGQLVAAKRVLIVEPAPPRKKSYREMEEEYDDGDE